MGEIMNKKLIFTLIFCLFSNGIKAESQKAPFYKNDATMAQATSLLFGVLLGIKYVTDGYDHGFNQVLSYTPVLIGKRQSGVFQAGSIKNYGLVNLRTLAGKVNNALPGSVIIASGLVAAWYVGKVIKNKLLPNTELISTDSLGLQQGD